jgi:hypothetical protein
MSLWKHIRHGWEQFFSHIKFDVGQGTRIRFLLDLWCGEDALSMAFPLLFRIARCKDALVVDNLC